MTPDALEIRIDPEIASLFEDLTIWTYDGLKRDIQKNGIEAPLVVAEDGTVVCGHQRFKIAQELGIEPPYRIKHFENKREMIEYAINDNLLRRHLNTYCKGLVALRYLPYAKEKTMERMLSTLKKGSELPQRKKRGRG